jgi:hypothetical protein
MKHFKKDKFFLQSLLTAYHGNSSHDHEKQQQDDYDSWEQCGAARLIDEARLEEKAHDEHDHADYRHNGHKN